MESPYLNRGEAIILTTNRISADSGVYEVMLTTERIFFIDNQDVWFDPWIIPISALLSVQGGKTPGQDPAITLVFRPVEDGSARQPLNLIFSQDVYENRKPERDDWLRSLIQLSIHQREREAVPEMPGLPEIIREKGLRPKVRHGVTPDRVRPLSNVVERRKAPAPVTVIPDDVEEPPIDHTPVRGTPPPVPASPARVKIPRIIEELSPVKITPAMLESQEPAAGEDVFPEARIPAIPTPGESWTVPQEEEQERSPLPEAETITTSESVPADGTAPEQAVTEPQKAAVISRALDTGAVQPGPEPEPAPEPALAEPWEAAVISGAPDTGAVQPGPEPEPAPEPALAEPQKAAVICGALDTGAVQPGPESEPVQGLPQAGVREVSESAATSAVPEHVTDESPGQTTTVMPGKPEPASAEVPPDRHAIPPGSRIRPPGITIAYAAVLLLIIALAAAGAMLLLQQGPGQTGIPITPTQRITLPVTPLPSISVPQVGFWVGVNSTAEYFSTIDTPVTPLPPGGQVTTLPPETMLPATRPSPAVPPATTRITTPVTSTPASPVPQEGIWIRVNSTAYYLGTVGNPGLMQQVSGSGDNFYRVLKDDRSVQISVQKQDNSGALLAVAVYRNGTLLGTRSVTSPMGTVGLLIDPRTGRAPGLTENDTLPGHATTPPMLEDY